MSPLRGIPASTKAAQAALIAHARTWPTRSQGSSKSKVSHTHVIWFEHIIFISFQPSTFLAKSINFFNNQNWDSNLDLIYVALQDWHDNQAEWGRIQLHRHAQPATSSISCLSPKDNISPKRRRISIQEECVLITFYLWASCARTPCSIVREMWSPEIWWRYRCWGA